MGPIPSGRRPRSCGDGSTIGAATTLESHPRARPCLHVAPAHLAQFGVVRRSLPLPLLALPHVVARRQQQGQDQGDTIHGALPPLAARRSALASDPACAAAPR
jgi:hypothetical protein